MFKALAHQRDGDAFASRNEWTEALDRYRRALALCEQRVSAEPDSIEWRRRLATVHGRVGWACFRLRKDDAALEHFRLGREIAAVLLSENSRAPMYMREVLWFDQRIGDVKNGRAAE